MKWEYLILVIILFREMSFIIFDSLLSGINNLNYRVKTTMVKILSYLCKHGGLSYSLVLLQEGSKRKSTNPANAERPVSDHRNRQLTDK